MGAPSLLPLGLWPGMLACEDGVVIDVPVRISYGLRKGSSTIDGLELYRSLLQSRVSPFRQKYLIEQAAYLIVSVQRNHICASWTIPAINVVWVGRRQPVR